MPVLKFAPVRTLLAIAALLIPMTVAGPAHAVGRTIWIADSMDGKLTSYPATNSVGTATGCPKDNLLPTYSGAGGLKNAVDNAVAGDEIIICNRTNATRSIFDLSTLSENMADPLARTLRARVSLTVTGAANSGGVRPLIEGGSIAASGVTRIFDVNAGIGDTVVIRGLTLANGFAKGDKDSLCNSGGQCGGAIRVQSGQLRVSRSVIQDSRAGRAGAGIAVISNSGATVTIDSTTFINNVADIEGGAYFDGGSNSASIINSTFTGNAATKSSGAVARAALGDTSFNHVTAIDNSSTGRVLSGGGISIKNSIVGQRISTTTLCDNTVKVGTGNLLTDLSCPGAIAWVPDAVDVSSVTGFQNLRLGWLFASGSVGLPHYRLLTGSPAINFDNQGETDPTYDLLGMPRPSGLDTHADAGAYEVSSVGIVRPFTSSLAYAPIADLHKQVSVRPTNYPEYDPAIAITYQSLTPSVCSIDYTKAPDQAITNLTQTGICTIESHVAQATSGTAYEEATQFASFRVIVPHAPSQPQNIIIKSSLTSFTITYSEPADDGGSPVTKYALIAEPRLGGVPKSVTCTRSPCVIPQLVSDNPYRIKFQVENQGGYRAFYIINDRIRTSKPTFPTVVQNVAASGTKGGVNVSWQAPRTSGASALVNYIVRVYATNNAVKVLTEKTVPAKSTLSKITWKGAKSKTQYMLTVIAINEAGGSQPTSLVKFKTK